MDAPGEDIWTAACAHYLQRTWRTVDPDQLREVAAELWRDDRLRAMAPADAAPAESMDFMRQYSGELVATV